MHLFATAITFFALFYASIVDIKTREVPDWLSYSLIAVGLGVHAIEATISSNALIFLGSLGGFLGGLSFGWLMFRMGQWGGGDAKLMMGIGAAFGVPLLWSAPYISILPIPQLISYVMNLILVGAAYGLVWSIGLAIRNHKAVGAHFGHYSKISRIWRFPLQFAVVIASILAIIYLEGELRFWVQLLLLMIFSSGYLWMFVKAVEDGAMKKRIPPEKLTEGDWIAEKVIVGKKIIASPKDLGVSKEQIKQLISFRKKHRLKDVLIKEGVPFVPSLLIAFIVTIIFGNLLLFFIP